MKLKAFKAAWCGPCRTLTPTLEELRNDGFNIEYVDVDENSEETTKFGVRGIPTVILLDDNEKELKRLMGIQTKDTLIDLFK